MKRNLCRRIGDKASRGLRGNHGTKGKISRREFLKTGAVSLGVVALGGLPRQVFGAPAVIKGTKLSILQGSYFIAPGQDLYKKQAQEWGEASGVTMACDFLNWPDLQPKIAAAIQAKGYDIVELWPGWNYLYSKNLVDVSDIAETFEKRNGGRMKTICRAAFVLLLSFSAWAQHPQHPTGAMDQKHFRKELVFAEIAGVV